MKGVQDIQEKVPALSNPLLNQPISDADLAKKILETKDKMGPSTENREVHNPDEEFEELPGQNEPPEFRDFHKASVLYAAQNKLLSQIYNAQGQIVEVMELIKTVPSQELLAASDQLHMCIKNIETHIRSLRHKDS